MIRIGIIGTGLIAQEHARAIAMVRDRARLVAAADIDAERLDKFSGAFQVLRPYRDAAALIVAPDVDLVVIATPPAAHEELVVTALENGKYVFCEKPLAQSLASATRILQTEAVHAGRLAVSYQLRYESSFRRLIWLCEQGWIGEIQSALIERHSYIPHVNSRRSGWWGSWKVAGGGVLITQLIHELDFLLLVMGRPISVMATMDTRYTTIESEDYVEATLRFEGGGTARCVASVNSGRQGGGFTIQGSEGTAGLPWNLTMKDPHRIPAAMRELDMALPDTRPQSSSLIGRGARFVGRQMGVSLEPPLTPHALLYQEIARNIGKGVALPIPPSEAIGSLELCFAAYESALTGREVSVAMGPKSSVYGGVLKEDYDAYKSLRKRSEHAGSRIIRGNGNSGVVRVGLVGVDTSHASSFTSILHNPDDPFHIPGARVVAAYPGGSPDMPISASRVAGFTSELRDLYGIRIVDSPEEVAEACDLVCLLSSDGRTHPALFRAVARCSKRIFVDKPFAVSTADAQDMFAHAAETGSRVFASSAFRYADDLVNALNSIRASGERVKTCRVRYWLQIQETQGRYFWYGIHASEMLLAVMGKGVREVDASGYGDQDAINVSYEDGRQSSLIGCQTDGTFHVSIETDKRTLEVDLSASMSSLAARVLAAALDVLTEGKFPRLWGATAAGSVSGNRPGRFLDPDNEETLRVISLLDAAQRSHSSKEKATLERTAVPVSL
jgi:predicted dehydrogenase